jgi:hypothetical protein
MTSVTDLRMGGEKVLRAAKVAVNSPGDTAALGAAQKELGGHVRKVFELVWYVHFTPAFYYFLLHFLHKP